MNCQSYASCYVCSVAISFARFKTTGKSSLKFAIDECKESKERINLHYTDLFSVAEREVIRNWHTKSFALMQFYTYKHIKFFNAYSQI